MRVISIAAIIVCVAAAPALAQTPAPRPDPDPALEAKARDHFDKGRAFYNVGQYDQAIAEFQQAYLLTKEPLLLFNIAQSYRLKGDCEQALRFYRNYLREQPEPPILEEVEAAVKLCEQKQREPPPDTPTVAPPTERDRPDGRGLRIAGLVTASVGVVATGMGIYFGLAARADARSVEEHTGVWGPEQEDLEASGQRKETLFFVFTGTGVAAIIGGGILYYLGHRQAARTPPVAIAPAPDGFRIAWTIRF